MAGYMIAEVWCDECGLREVANDVAAALRNFSNSVLTPYQTTGTLTPSTNPERTHNAR